MLKTAPQKKRFIWKTSALCSASIINSLAQKLQHKAADRSSMPVRCMCHSARTAASKASMKLPRTAKLSALQQLLHTERGRHCNHARPDGSCFMCVLTCAATIGNPATPFPASLPERPYPIQSNLPIQSTAQSCIPEAYWRLINMYPTFFYQD